MSAMSEDLDLPYDETTSFMNDDDDGFDEIRDDAVRIASEHDTIVSSTPNEPDVSPSPPPDNLTNIP